MLMMARDTSGEVGWESLLERLCETHTMRGTSDCLCMVFSFI